MDLKIGNIVNTERKFIVKAEPSALIPMTDWVTSLGIPKETYWIDQLYVDGIKYRRISEDKTEIMFGVPYTTTDVVGYTKNVKKGNITAVMESMEREFTDAAAKVNHVISRKERTSYVVTIDGKEFHIDFDDYLVPKMLIIEVSGEHLEEFTPPDMLVEVTGDERYSAKEIYKKVQEFAKTFTV